MPFLPHADQFRFGAEVTGSGDGASMFCGRMRSALSLTSRKILRSKFRQDPGSTNRSRRPFTFRERLFDRCPHLRMTKVKQWRRGNKRFLSSRIWLTGKSIINQSLHRPLLGHRPPTWLLQALHLFFNDQNRSKRSRVTWAQRKSRSVGYIQTRASTGLTQHPQIGGPPKLPLQITAKHR